MLSRVQQSAIARRSKLGHMAHCNNSNLVRLVNQKPAAVTKPFPFLSLPWELRNEVYKHLFSRDGQDLSSILYVNKHVGEEAWCALRNQQPMVLVTLSLEQLEASCEYINHMLTPDEFWTMPAAPHTSDRIYRLPDTHDHEHMQKHHNYDLHLRMTDSDLLMSEKAANIVIIGRSAIDTFARKFARWRLPVWGSAGPCINELQLEFIFSPAASMQQINRQNSILHLFSGHVWNLPLVTITGATDTAITKSVLQHLSQHRFTSLQMLVDMFCTSYLEAIHQWAYHRDQDVPLPIMRRLWELLTMSWRMGENELMTDTITCVSAGGQQHVWTATEVFEYLIAASRLIIAALHIQRAQRSRTTADFDTEMAQADHHAKSALEQAESMGDPYETIFTEAHLTIMVTSQALGRKEAYRQAKSKIREVDSDLLIKGDIEVDYMYRLHEQRRGRIFVFGPEWMKLKLYEMLRTPSTCKNCEVHDADHGLKR